MGEKPKKRKKIIMFRKKYKIKNSCKDKQPKGKLGSRSCPNTLPSQTGKLATHSSKQHRLINKVLQF